MFTPGRPAVNDPYDCRMQPVALALLSPHNRLCKFLCFILARTINRAKNRGRRLDGVTYPLSQNVRTFCCPGVPRGGGVGSLSVFESLTWRWLSMPANLPRRRRRFATRRKRINIRIVAFRAAPDPCFKNQRGHPGTPRTKFCPAGQVHRQ